MLKSLFPEAEIIGIQAYKHSCFLLYCTKSESMFLKEVGKDCREKLHVASERPWKPLLEHPKTAVQKNLTY
jgi:hypothetical protein